MNSESVLSLMPRWLESSVVILETREKYSKFWSGSSESIVFCPWQLLVFAGLTVPSRAGRQRGGRDLSNWPAGCGAVLHKCGAVGLVVEPQSSDRA